MKTIFAVSCLALNLLSAVSFPISVALWHFTNPSFFDHTLSDFQYFALSNFAAINILPIKVSSSFNHISQVDGGVAYQEDSEMQSVNNKVGISA